MTHQANTTMHTKARHTALENAQPGDIVLFHHERGWSRTISSFSGSRYYHVALYAGDQNVIESRVRGVSMRDVSQAKIRLYFRIIPASSGEEVGLEALDWALGKTRRAQCILQHWRPHFGLSVGLHHWPGRCRLATARKDILRRTGRSSL